MSTITLKLTSIAHGGEAVGRYEGKVVFVPLTIPGETVRIQLVEERERYARGQLLEIIEPSEHRVSPPCEYFGLCGGCQWQHMDYDLQLRLKRQIVRDQLQHVGKQHDPCVLPTVGMNNPWAYRNRVRLRMNERGSLGYYALHTHDVVPIDRCFITHPLLDEMWEMLDVEFEGLIDLSLRAGIHTAERMVVLRGRSETPPELMLEMPISCLYLPEQGEPVVMAGRSYYVEGLRGRPFQISGPSFFQVNTLQMERLIDVVEEYLALGPEEELLDAYCGVGALALSFSHQVARVTGIESSPWAVNDAVANAVEDNVRFYQGDVADVLADTDISCNALVLDPPRAGCTREALEALAQCGPRRMVYVSCNPSAFARDVLRLNRLGYELVEVQPVDMFPQTYHVECVGLLCRKDKG
ncbi:MAG: class I SAM-dependent RNA methyltransferase [Chloroflexota bacterium]|nr:class I SAM-dependent RNA methyltransferase [Chloroflexota bacterium]